MSFVKRLVPGCVAVAALALAGLGGGLTWAASAADEKLVYADTPAPTSLVASTDPDSIARGRYLVYGPGHCAQCHSEEDRAHPERTGDAPISGGLVFGMGPIGSFYGRNLTSHAELGIGRRTDAELARVLRSGVLPDGRISVFMRYSAANLSDADIVDVLSYLRSTAPVAKDVPPGDLTFLGRAAITLAFPPLVPRSDAPAGVPAGAEPSVERGRYLAENVMLCVSCHSQFDMATFASIGPKAGGGTAEPSRGADTEMEYASPNLTSHPTGITGKLDEDAFVARLRAGRIHASSIMPWENVQNTTDTDLRSVYRYLRSLPPVDADNGPTYRKIGWKPGE